MTTLLATLGIVFVAELGDKTQLVALGLGARYRLAPVLAGLALGYTAATLLAAAAGGLVGAALPTRVVGIGGAVLFFAFAVWMLRARSSDPEEIADPRPGRVVLSVAAAIFVGEFGDKTMLATATLAARDNPVMVWIGASVGIMLAGSLSVLFGRFLGTRLPERVTRIGAAALFVVFGVALLVTSL